MTETIREAKVTNINDPDQKGKIQVRILPEMLDFSVNDLPWASKYSIGTGTSSDNGIHELPEVDSFIRVCIEDWPYLKRIRYISDDYVEGLYIYSKFASVSISELGNQTYPQPFFKCYKDGTIEFHNSETSEHGVFFKGGGYFLQDATGNFFLNATSGKVKVYNTLTDLKTIIKSLQEVLLGLVTPLKILDSKGLPCTYQNVATDLPKVQQVLVNLNNLMED